MTAHTQNRVEIEVTNENLWFLERYLNVFDFVDLFPADALSTRTSEGVAVTFKTDTGFEFESDIDGEKMQLHNRSRHRGWMRWTTEHKLNPGDRILVEKAGDRVYSLRLEPKQRV